MARSIGDVLLDSQLPTRLERAGTQRALRFTWRKAAQRRLEAYRQAVMHPHVAAPAIVHR